MPLVKQTFCHYRNIFSTCTYRYLYLQNFSNSDIWGATIT